MRVIAARSNRCEQIVAARQKAGMTQKDLSREIHVPLWLVDRFERGLEDAGPYVPSIVRATGHQIVWGGSSHTPAREARSFRAEWVVALRREPSTTLILGVLTTLIVIRFFTEGIAVLPRSTTFIDVPIFLLLVGVAITRGRSLPRRDASFTLLGTLFLVIVVATTVVNIGRVHPAPVLLFLYGFLGPLAIYQAVYRLWPVGQAIKLSRLLVGLALIQFVVVAAIDLPEFLRTRDPDVVSGTFGDNPYQLVFYLLVTAALLAGIATFEKRRLAARFAPLLFVAIAATIFLAQYRTVLITTMMTLLVVAGFLSIARGRGFLLGVALITAFIAMLSVVQTHFPETKFETVVSTIQSDPGFYLSTRLHSADGLYALYSDHPETVVTGTGPGTFSSRSWRTFAILKRTRTAVAAPLAEKLTGGGYRTDIADKYVVSRLRDSEAIQGSYALTQPFSSYASLLAEVGVLGCAALIGLYLVALFRSARFTLTAFRTAVPGDPLPALLLASTIAFLVLLQLGAFENWLEVTRLTFPSWTLLAVATKECRARQAADEA